ncbi:MAG: site-specific integrase [Planctomycetota bacterium]|nr:site-specific integrase [Planctomycetota bacterium]
MPDEVASPSRSLTVLECEALLEAAGEQSADRRLHYLLRLRTGLRGSESARLRWSDVSLERGLLSLRAEVTKNRKADVLPLADDLVEALVESQAEALRRGRPVGPDDPVFPSIPNRLTWQRDLERAGIPERAPMSSADPRIGRADRKCLRTTFGSHLMRAQDKAKGRRGREVDLTLVSLLMRHTPVGGMKLTLETYGDPDAILARKREAIEKLTAWYRQQVEALATGSAAG